MQLIFILLMQQEQNGPNKMTQHNLASCDVYFNRTRYNSQR